MNPSSSSNWPGISSRLLEKSYHYACHYCSTKLSSALESVSEVLLKRGEERHFRSTTFVLQHLILTLRRKSEMILSLIAEDVCTPESFHWRTQIQYSTETESLYVLPDQPSTVRRLTLGSEHYGSSYSILGSRHNVMSLKGHSPGPPGAKMQESNSLVASSKSLLSSRNALLANASGTSINELNRGTGIRSVAGCPIPLKCFVHCHQTTLPYGFEFLGSSTHLILTPQTENFLLSLVNAMASHAYPLVNSASHSFGATTTGKDVAVVSM